VADTSDFIKTNAVESLKSLTLTHRLPSVTSFLALLKAGFLTTSVSQSQNSASSRLGIAKSLTDLGEEGYATQDTMTLIKILLQDKDSEVR
jgi:hypothetical protein